MPSLLEKRLSTRQYRLHCKNEQPAATPSSFEHTHTGNTIMPRLGDSPENDDEMRPLTPRRQAASAYPAGGRSQTIVYAILLFLTFYWILPNFFFRVRLASTGFCFSLCERLANFCLLL